jgi:hypothetical protein
MLPPHFWSYFKKNSVALAREQTMPTEATYAIKIKEREIQYIYLYWCISPAATFSESTFIKSYWFSQNFMDTTIFWIIIENSESAIILGRDLLALHSLRNHCL